MSCWVFEGVSVCSWCRGEASHHQFRWCGRCDGNGSVADPMDRESQVAGRPSWQWRQIPCGCGCGIVTMDGEVLDGAARNRVKAGMWG